MFVNSLQIKMNLLLLNLFESNQKLAEEDEDKKRKTLNFYDCDFSLWL